MVENEWAQFPLNAIGRYKGGRNWHPFHRAADGDHRDARGLRIVTFDEVKVLGVEAVRRWMEDNNFVALDMGQLMHGAQRARPAQGLEGMAIEPAPQPAPVVWPSVTLAMINVLRRHLGDAVQVDYEVDTVRIGGVVISRYVLQDLAEAARPPAARKPDDGRLDRLEARVRALESTLHIVGGGPRHR